MLRLSLPPLPSPLFPTFPFPLLQLQAYFVNLRSVSQMLI